MHGIEQRRCKGETLKTASWGITDTVFMKFYPFAGSSGVNVTNVYNNWQYRNDNIYSGIPLEETKYINSYDPIDPIKESIIITNAPNVDIEIHQLPFGRKFK